MDWEEGLWGTDPTKKETTPGTLDSATINKLKTELATTSVTTSGDVEVTENLTQTEKFSRELFSTIASLNQNGAVDQATIDQLGATLAERISNPVVRKVFLISEIKIVSDTSFQTFANYNITLNSIIERHRVNYTVLDVLQKFVADENNIDMRVLLELDPIITQNSQMIQEMANMNVPQSFAALHLDVINALERLIENLNDIKLFESDVIVALSGISQYGPNTILLESAAKNLADAITKKLNN